MRLAYREFLDLLVQKASLVTLDFQEFLERNPHVREVLALGQKGGRLELIVRVTR